MTTTVTVEATRVAAARRWFRQQGYTAVEADGVSVMVTPAHPLTWEANWAHAGPSATADALFAALSRHHPIGWQVVGVDALTPPAIEAALALADFRAELTLIEMATDTVVSVSAMPSLRLEPVGEAQWSRFARLVDIDQREGKRTGEHDERVAAGLLDGMRRRRGLCDYWLLVEDGEDAGYGMTAACPGGLGLIENLFTLPDRRGRGLMSSFIATAVARLRVAGCDAVFLDAHAHDTPKQLYARLGFVPVAVTRTWVRHTG